MFIIMIYGFQNEYRDKKVVVSATIISTTRLHPFARSWFYNATAVHGALWWLRQSHSVNYTNHQHSPFARWRHDFRQAAARRCKLHFPRYRFVKVSWKSVQLFPRTVVSFVKHICYRLIGGCENYCHVAPGPHLVGNGLSRGPWQSQHRLTCKLSVRLCLVANDWLI